MDEEDLLKKPKSSKRSSSPTKTSKAPVVSDQKQRRSSSPAKKSSQSQPKKDKLDSFLDAKKDDLSRGVNSSAHSTSGGVKTKKASSRKSSSASVTPAELSPSRKKKASISTMISSSHAVPPTPGSKETRKKDKLDLFLESKAPSQDDEQSSVNKKIRKKKISSAASCDAGMEFLATQEDLNFASGIGSGAETKRRSTRKKSVDTIDSANSYGDTSVQTASSHEGERKKVRSNHRRSHKSDADGKEVKRIPSTIQEEKGSNAELKKKKAPKSPSGRKSSRKGSVSSTVSTLSYSDSSQQPEVVKNPRMMRRMSNLAGAPIAIADPVKAKKTKKKKKKETSGLIEEEEPPPGPKKPMGRRGSLLIAGLPSAPANQRSTLNISGSKYEVAPKKKAQEDIFTNYLWTQQEEYPREWVQANRKQLQNSLKDNPLHKALDSRGAEVLSYG